jgi:hypothetical protein
MLIRSQDKKILINFDNMQSISISGYMVENKRVYEDEENATTWYIACVSQDYSPFIGHYTTEAKAIKVMDMIQAEFLRCVETGENGVRTAVYDFPKAFQMPQDLEV